MCGSNAGSENFLENTVKEFSTKKQMRFIYQIFLRSCMLYQSYLRIIDRKRKEIEAHIGGTIRRKWS